MVAVQSGKPQAKVSARTRPPEVAATAARARGLVRCRQEPGAIVVVSAVGDVPPFGRWSRTGARPGDRGESGAKSRCRCCLLRRFLQCRCRCGVTVRLIRQPDTGACARRHRSAGWRSPTGKSAGCSPGIRTCGLCWPMTGSARTVGGSPRQCGGFRSAPMRLRRGQAHLSAWTLPSTPATGAC